MDSFQTTVDENGVIQIPEEFINHLGWTENTSLLFLMDGENIIVKEKTDWTVDDFQENIEVIIERINETGKSHHLLHEGKVFVIAPHNDNIQKMIDDLKK